MSGLHDEKLRCYLMVTLDDLERGTSGFSKGHSIVIPMSKFRRMAELAVKQIELEQLK